MDHIPVHIGATDLKNILYTTVIPKWNQWTNNYPLPIDSLVMQNRNWVVLVPRNPDHNVIAEQFFKLGWKGSPTFKKRKAIINLHVLNDIYGEILTCKEAEEFKAEMVDNDGTAVVDFTVGVIFANSNNMLNQIVSSVS